MRVELGVCLHYKFPVCVSVSLTDAYGPSSQTISRNGNKEQARNHLTRLVKAVGIDDFQNPNPHADASIEVTRMDALAKAYVEQSAVDPPSKFSPMHALAHPSRWGASQVQR